MGALDCMSVSGNGMVPRTANSKEVFAISNSSLNDKGRDLESQLSKPTSLTAKRSVLWTIGIDIPLVLICGLLIGLFELGLIPSHQAGFYCNDPALSFDFTGDTVSMAALMLSVIFLPMGVILVTEAIFVDSDFLTPSSRMYQAIRNTMWVYRNYAYGLFFNLGLVEVIKGITGMPRPTFFAICSPSTLSTCSGSEFVTTYKCTSDKFSAWFQSDAAHSFPSGHASLSVFCGLFLAWYLQKRVFSWRHHSIFTVPVLQMILFTYAAYCSLTRITDHRHHWWDVLAGTILGVICVFYSIMILCKNFSESKFSSDISSAEIQLLDRHRT